MSQGRRLSLRLLGTGSSGGVPRVGNNWGACDPAEPRNRRLRCSALISLSEADQTEPCTRILIDTSPDMREQLLSASVGHLDAVLFSHDHADQTHGIDDVRPLVIAQRQTIPAYLDHATAQSLIPKFRYCFEGLGGYPPILDLQPELKAGREIRIQGQGPYVRVLPLQQSHGRISSLGFRFGPIAYCNDVNGFPDETVEALADLDLLVIDALRYNPHPSHFHVEEALEWIERLKPKRAVLTNLHVDLDYTTLQSELPASVEVGYDGWSVEIDLD
ncbi:MAG: MBL fold metallo-hydrolase [Henriciella sp.]